MRTTRELLIKIEASSITTVTPPSRIKLSPRGKQVLELFMHSFTYQQIAMQLGMSGEWGSQALRKNAVEKWL